MFKILKDKIFSKNYFVHFGCGGKGIGGNLI